MTKIPKFKTEAEEAKFWATHDFTDYIDDTEEVELELSPELSQTIRDRFVIRLTPGQRKKLEKIAEKKGVKPQNLINSWIDQGIGENV